jgi:hypothetical protein
MVIGPPDGDLTNERILPVEALAGIVDGEPRIAVLVALEPGELERLEAMPSPGVWLTFITSQLAPFSVEVADGQGAEPWL